MSGVEEAIGILLWVPHILSYTMISDIYCIPFMFIKMHLFIKILKRAPVMKNSSIMFSVSQSRLALIPVINFELISVDCGDI